MVLSTSADEKKQDDDLVILFDVSGDLAAGFELSPPSPHSACASMNVE